MPGVHRSQLAGSRPGAPERGDNQGAASDGQRADCVEGGRPTRLASCVFRSAPFWTTSPWSWRPWRRLGPRLNNKEAEKRHRRAPTAGFLRFASPAGRPREMIGESRRNRSGTPLHATVIRLFFCETDLFWHGEGFLCWNLET
ncbi:L antigen family member 3-like isoform X1 [Denticeps clupeoides]|uniref:L antigen family member 3-like isoform X1 n=1 Tax=Denticeps clupeoides TaxID=299321 RepID=UPI0010A39CC6|nr:EKC/KEOPS complex subunit LAGE3 isoform X1 [Denticeps clupeoides]